MIAGTQVANADTIKIQQGDTVWAYAQKYHVSIDDIVKSNKLADANLIIAGKTINIPGVTTGSSATATSIAVSGSATTATSAVSASAATSASASTAATSTAVTSAASASSAVASSASSTASATSASSVASTSSAASVASTASSTSTTAASTVSANTTSTTTASTTTTNTTTTTTNSGSMARGGGVSAALAIANSGIGYVYGGSSLSGFDCSGLVQYVYGLSSSYRTTVQQAKLGTHHYDVANAPYGALVFWGSESAPYHVGISLGNGTYVAAQNSQKGIGVFSQTYYTPSFYINY